MDALANIIGTSGIPALFYYGFMAIASVFLSGWFLKTKLAAICEENNKGIEEKMQALIARVARLEEEAVRKEQHDKEMSALSNTLSDIQRDVREGFANQATRIDALFASRVAQ